MVRITKNGPASRERRLEELSEMSDRELAKRLEELEGQYSEGIGDPAETEREMKLIERLIAQRASVSWSHDGFPPEGSPGQGLAEYALILALLAVIAIGAWVFLGDNNASDVRIKASIQKLTGIENPLFESIGHFTTVYRVSVDGKSILVGCIIPNRLAETDLVCEILE